MPPKSPLDANPLAYITNEDLHSYNFRSLSELLSVVQIRHLITVRRWETFLRSGAELQVHGSVDPGVIKETVDHNIQGIKNSVPAVSSLSRSELVFRPAMCLDRIFSYRNQSVFPDLKVLLIGSRTEYEVLTAFAYGIAPSQLHAVDLISYSPWITPGDMHALPYPDNHFDLVIMGWVLGYSKTPRTVAREVVRVSRPGAVVSIGNDCIPEALRKSNAFTAEERPQSMKDLLGCFDGSVGRVYFSHEPDYRKTDVPDFLGHLIGTFEIRK